MPGMPRGIVGRENPMRLTWRDGIETMLIAAVVLVTLAVTQAWGWPLLGTPRAGVVAVGVLGIAMCSVAGSRAASKDPFIVTTTVLAVVTLGLIVAGLIAGTETLLVALAITLVVMWVLTTLRHAIEGSQTPGQPAAAG